MPSLSCYLIMELIFRQRLDRPDKLGQAAIFGNLHWAGGHRWKMPTGVKVLPQHWQPTKGLYWMVLLKAFPVR